MATTQTDVRTKVVAPKNTRRNEIIAIALAACGALLALCLVSYNPNDSSWNSAGQDVAHNLVGAIGANAAAAMFQMVGLAAYLLPLLLLAAAWRRFRTRRIHAPLSRIAGLLLLIVASSALVSLSNIRPLFDGSFQPGGLMGTLFARLFSSGLNTVGAAVLLSAAAAMGLLFATDFSFIRAYEWMTEEFGNRFAFMRAIPERFRAWRDRRRERALVRMEMRQQARAERDAQREALRHGQDLSGAERVEQFMRETVPAENLSAMTAIKRSVVASQPEATTKQVAGEVKVAAPEISKGAQAATASASAAIKESVAQPKQAAAAASAYARAAAAEKATEKSEAAEIAEMVNGASVVRVDLDEAESKSVSQASEKSRRGAPSIAVINDYKIPNVSFLNPPPPHSQQADEELLGLATRLAERCKEFNVTGQIKHICPGPVVTTYEFKPDPGVKYSRVTGLSDDLCLALKAESIRIDRMPGKPHIGIEVPNPHRETIHLREVIESRQFQESQSKLTIALGKTIDGLNYVADLTKMPHLLIAGTTGAGKSVALNAIIVSIVYKARPDEVKFILVDPKRLELGLYADIPHLATPIITDPKRAAISLKWAVAEMERRYRELAGWGVRNIDGYNTEVARRNFAQDFGETGEEWKPLPSLPYIVIIIDELADLMMVAGHEVEESITRLAQMARAVGIHLVLATQRPSVDVITGLIKANFPSRISFRVSSKVDSRTIIDANGAEQLLGRGDMLFLPPGTSRLVRVHGAYVDENEINRIVNHIKEQCAPAYDESITQTEDEAMGMDGAGGERDELFEDALRICCEMKRASTSVLQRRLRIGYGRAAAILDMMERQSLIGQADGARPRPMLSRAFEMVSEWDEMSSEV
ncbi:MAG TPA: DNA translocase FtsK 4TM domain-containing protein [Pyrinomonadaceae bacterium]|nr:DNA translocase FtsK 4TM domain-containing protein [Pyrinomonadaceae bacterium]